MPHSLHRQGDPEALARVPTATGLENRGSRLVAIAHRSVSSCGLQTCAGVAASGSIGTYKTCQMSQMHCTTSIMDIELAQDAVDMLRNRAGANDQTIRDLLIRPT